MAQKIVTLCDPHQANDEEVPGAPWVVTMQGPEDSRPTTWAIDLCEDDGKTLRDLAAMLGAVGRVTEGPRRGMPTAARKAAREAAQAHRAPEDQRGVPCPLEDCDSVLANESSRAAHMRQQHGMSIAAALGQPEPYGCPDCDFRSARPQGLGAHRRAVHGTASARAE